MTYVYRGRKPDVSLPDLGTLNQAIMRARTQDALVPTLDVCGSNEGWLRHRYRHEKPCPACQDAHGTPARKTRVSTA